MRGPGLLPLFIFLFSCTGWACTAHAQSDLGAGADVKGSIEKDVSLPQKEGSKKLQFVTVPFFDSKISDADVVGFKK